MHSKEEISKKGVLVSQCMLDNSLYTVLGVCSGVAIFSKTRIKRHFVIAITAGTFADLVIGYFGTCRPLREDFELAKAEYELVNPSVKAQPVIPSYLRYKGGEYTTIKPGSEAKIDVRENSETKDP
jgi:hypothetical protein